MAKLIEVVPALGPLRAQLAARVGKSSPYQDLLIDMACISAWFWLARGAHTPDAGLLAAAVFALEAARIDDDVQVSDRGACALATLDVVRGDSAAVADLTGKVFRLPPAYSNATAQALVIDHLSGHRSWAHARNPIGWVRSRASGIYRIDELGGGPIKRSDAMRATVSLPVIDVGVDDVVLEHVVDVPAEATRGQRYVQKALDELKRAAGGDRDLHDYLAARLQVRGAAADAWRHLGWTAARGRRVDRRFRRLRAILRRDPQLHEEVFEPHVRGLSDASISWYREHLFFGGWVYQHVPPLTP